MQVVYFLHLFEQFFLPVVLTFQPLLSVYFALGNGLAKGDGVDEVVFEYSGVDPYARDVVCVVLLAEILKFI